MKRLMVTGPREASFEDVAVPPCQADEVLVRARVTAISTGTELRVYRGIAVDEAGLFLHEQIPFQLPTTNGYSMVGEITESGADVSGLQIHDRVFVPAPHCQYAAVPQSLVIPLPDNVPDDEAVFLNIVEVAHRGLRQGNPPPGVRVVIVGAGVIGLSLLAYLGALGFQTAIIDPVATRLKIARKIGAELAVAPQDAGAIERVEEFLGDGADVAFEAASNWEAVRTAMQLTRIDGKVVVLSRLTQSPEFNPLGHPFLGKRLSLVTSYGYPPDGHRWDRSHSIASTIALMDRRQLPIRPLITHRFPADELPEVYHRLDKGDRSIVGALVQWGG